MLKNFIVQIMISSLKKPEKSHMRVPFFLKFSRGGPWTPAVDAFLCGFIFLTNELSSYKKHRLNTRE